MDENVLLPAPHRQLAASQENVLLCSLAENRAAALGKLCAGFPVKPGISAEEFAPYYLCGIQTEQTELPPPCSVLAFFWEGDWWA